MDWLTPENVVAVVTSVAGLAATLYVLWREQGLWEVRKRIGYRIQMATPIGNVPTGADPGTRRLFANVPRDATLVLVRIENDGKQGITAESYASPDRAPGLVVLFEEGLTVEAVAATTPDSLSFLRAFLTDETLTHEHNQLHIPKVPLNPGQHFKLLVLLTGGPVDADEVKVRGGIQGGTVVRTSSMSVDAKPPVFSRPAQYLAGALTALLLGLSGIILFNDDAPPPRGCATGTLRIIGSTAFEPVAKELAGKYMKDCPGSTITVEAHGSASGVRELDGLGKAADADREGAPAVIALSDGPATDDDATTLTANKVAVSAFALVVNNSVKLDNLTTSQVRQLYRGDITDWSEITKSGGKQPVTLISRGSSSGTRAALQRRLLGGAFELNDSSTDCEHRTNPQVPVIRCELDSTDQVLERVSQLPGAIGYSELRETESLKNMHRVGIDGHRPTIDKIESSGYPFHEIEYAYTFGRPPTNSLTTSFLGYVLEGEGKSIVSTYGHLPCEVPDGLKACADTGGPADTS